MRRTLLATLVAASALAASAPTAGAASRARPDDRAAAQQFAVDAYHARLGVLAQRREIARRFRGVFDDRRCERALASAPERRTDRADAVLGLALAHALVDPTLPTIRRFAAQLDRVRTDDPALRAGRSAWAAEARLTASLPKVADACGTLDAWRRSGYDDRVLPAFDLTPLEGRFEALDRAITAAARRLRELGVARRDAVRFTGDRLLADLEPDPGFIGPPGRLTG